MKILIVDLWEKDMLPIKDAIYFSDGRSFSCKITSCPTQKIELGDEFDVNEFYKNNIDEVTNIDEIKEIKLSNSGYCSVGDGSYGSEGFIACLGKERNLIWVLYSEESNPFINVREDPVNTIIAESSSGFRLKINLNNPLELKIIPAPMS